MKEHTFKHELGLKAESNISGFSGIITCRSQNLNGCDRYFLSPKVTKDGTLPDGYWFDEAEIIIKKAKKIDPKNQDRGGFASTLK